LLVVARGIAPSRTSRFIDWWYLRWIVAGC
jgi:hypothetical protein